MYNRSGSPNIEDIEAFSTTYRVKLDEAELAKFVHENLTSSTGKSSTDYKSLLIKYDEQFASVKKERSLLQVERSLLI
jgi:hypothetical protein